MTKIPTNSFVNTPEIQEIHLKNGDAVRIEKGKSIPHYVKLKDGTQMWFKDNDYHRIDGPAIIHPNGKEEWYENGQIISNCESVYQS